MSRLQPKVSIIMPAFNAERYLPIAVESILRQTYLDWELIAVDDGSTDTSHAVLERYRRTDSRFRVISRPNTGLVVALNELAGIARGEYLARMDADDICLPQRLALQVGMLDDDPDLVCIGGGVELIDSAGKPICAPEPVIGDDDVQHEALRGRTPISHPVSIFRATAFRQVGGYRHEAFPAEDLDLFLRLGEVGKLDNVPETLLRYRVHEQSVSVTKRQAQLDKMQWVCQEAWRRRGLKDVEFCGGDGDHFTLPEDADAAAIHTNPTARALATSARRAAT